MGKKSKRTATIPRGAKRMPITQYSTFKHGCKYKAVHINFKWHGLWSWKAKLGYILWGADLWVGFIPVCKSIVLFNIIVWVLLFIIGR
jgi:hypothetical protein